MYVEFRDLSKSRLYLQQAGIWTAIRRLGGATSDKSASQAWQQRTEELLSLTIEQTITVLIGTRTALIATDPTKWDRGVVLAEVGNTSIVPQLLKRWHAIAREPVGAVSRYELPKGLLVAHRDRLLLFGPVSDDDGLWSRTVLLMAGRGGPTLASLPDFTEMSGDLPADFDGMIYLKGKPLERFLGSSKGGGLLLAAMKVNADDLTVEVRTRPAPARKPLRPSTQPAAPLMPADSIVVWSGRIDLASQLRPPTTSNASERSDLFDVLPRALGLLAEFGRKAIDAIADRAVVVIGRDSPDTGDGFQQPTIALVLDTALANDAASTLDAIVMLAWQWAVSNSPELEQSAKPTIAQKSSGDVEVHSFPLGALLARRTKCPFFERLDLSWCAVDHWLVISTSLRHAERIVASLRGRSPRIGDARALRNAAPTIDADADWMFVRGAELASMLQSWLDYLRTHEPKALEPEFWADWAARRIAKERRFGIGVRAVPDRPGEVEVVEIARRSFADGWLKPGDIIISAEGKPLTTTQPAQELADRFRASPSRATFQIGIRRLGRSMTIGVPVDPLPISNPERFDPIAAVRLAIELSEHVETLTALRMATPDDRFSARIRISWSRRN